MPTARLARCPLRACPVRWATGDDRLCHGHTDDLAALDAAGDGHAVAAELLAEPAGLASGAKAADRSR